MSPIPLPEAASFPFATQSNLFNFCASAPSFLRPLFCALFSVPSILRALRALYLGWTVVRKRKGICGTRACHSQSRKSIAGR